MGSMDKQHERRQLEDTLKEVNELIGEVLKERRELKSLETEVDQLYKAGALSDLRFAIEKQRALRMHKKVNGCLERLERQKKVTLWKIHELEKKDKQ